MSKKRRHARMRGKRRRRAEATEALLRKWGGGGLNVHPYASDNPFSFARSARGIQK